MHPSARRTTWSEAAAREASRFASLPERSEARTMNAMIDRAKRRLERGGRTTGILGDGRTTWVLGAAGAALVATSAVMIATRVKRQSRDWARRRPSMPTLAGGAGLRTEHTVTIMRPADELSARWRDLARLPEVMRHLESVTRLDSARSRWVVRGPRGARFTWDAELVADEPGRLIAWRSVDGADVDNAGSVRFTPAPGDRGTEVKVRMSYAPPAGRTGDAIAALFG